MIVSHLKSIDPLNNHGENIPMVPKIPYIDLVWLFKDCITNISLDKIQIGPKHLMFFAIHYAQNL